MPLKLHLILKRGYIQFPDGCCYRVPSKDENDTCYLTLTTEELIKLSKDDDNCS